MLDIGNRKQLFFDDLFFAESEGIEWVMGTPVQHPEPVLLPDKPWEERGIGAYNTVWREADGRWRMWYDASFLPGLVEGARRLGYAESADGLHWEKPELGLVEFQGSKANNIVAPHHERESLQGATVFRDERAPAAERYKLWTKFRPTDADYAKGSQPGLWAMYSPDGIEWSYYADQPNPPDTMCDTQNMFWWDDRLELYVGYARVRETQYLSEASEGREGSYRCVGRLTSPDCKEWSEQQIVFVADAEDLAIPVPFQRDDPRPNIDFYTSCATKYYAAQDAYFMLPAAYYHWGEDDFPATMDVQLLTSRDGIAWRRQGGRRAFLRQGFDDTALSGMLFANPWFIPVGDELWLYYNGTARKHGPGDDVERERRSGIFRASLRLDGFVAVEADYGGGSFSTPPLRFAGERMEVNFDGGAGGWLRVAVLDEGGAPIAGYGREEAGVVMGNGTAKEVCWQEPIGALAGRAVRLRFEMRDCRLYAMQFTGV